MTEHTLKISDKQIDFIRLVRRTPDVGDGWRVVSDTLRKITLHTVDEQPDIYETKEHEGRLFIRLSERGSILGDYL